MKKYEDFERKEVFLFFPLKFSIRTWFCICPQYFAYFTLSLSADHVFHNQGKMLVLPNRLLCSVISTSDQDFVSFLSNLWHPHTRIRIILFHAAQRDIPNLEFSPSHASIGVSQIAFPIMVWPKYDRRDFAQEERLALSYWTMISAICVVADESKCLDIPIWAFSTIREHLPFSLEYELILRLLLVHRNLAIWRWYPWFWRLLFEMLKILVEWILHKNQNYLLQYHRGEQLDLCIFGVCPPIQLFTSDISINDAKWTVAPDVLASSITSFSLLTFVRFHSGIFSNFSHSWSTAAFVAGIFTARGIGINLCTKLHCCSELFTLTAIWSSW